MLGWLASVPQGSAYLYIISTRIINLQHLSWLCIFVSWVLGIRLSWSHLWALGNSHFMMTPCLHEAFPLVESQ